MTPNTSKLAPINSLVLIAVQDTNEPIGKQAKYIPVTNLTGDSSYDSVVTTVAEFRVSDNIPTNKLVTTTDYGSGIWYYVGLNDGVYEDNTGTIIITADNHVWKRSFEGELNASWFGLSATSTRINNTAALQLAIDTLSNAGGGEIKVNYGEYSLNKIILKDKVSIIGSGIGHASVYFTSSDKEKGTVFLIDGQSGDDCVVFESNTSFTGFKNISIYNDNSNGIRAVVHIPGVLYPIMENVEISSRIHAATGVQTVGLLLSANTTSPNWETLYGVYLNVIVITNQSVGVHTALKLLGLSPVLRPNASRFIGGHFQGYSLSLLIDGELSNSAPQGIAFLGTTFESYYNSEQTVVYVPGSVGFNSFKHDQDRYGIVWMHLKQANQVTFTGCYTENGNSVFTYNDGTNGAHPSFPVIWVGTNASQTSIVGNTIVAGILDNGFGTTHPNKLSFLDQNSYASIEGEPVLSTSQVVLGSNGVAGLRVRESVVLIGSNNNTSTGEALQVLGHAKIDRIENVYTESDIIALRTGGVKLTLQDENNEASFSVEPVGLGSNAVFLVEDNEVIRLQPSKCIVQEQLEVNSTAVFAGQVTIPAGTADAHAINLLQLNNKKAAVSADSTSDTATPVGATYSQSEVQGILTELRNLKSELRNLKTNLRVANLLET